MELVELGKLCHFINGDRGKNYPSQSSFISKGIPFISAKDLIDKSISKDKLRYISETVYNKLGSGKLQNNDILFCLRGSLGKFGINHDNIKGAIASSLVIIRPKKELNLTYLGHYLSSPLFDRLVFKSDNGSSQPNLSVKNVKTFKIPLPNLKTQKKITQILDEADKLRQLNKALIQKYEALTQSLFLDMFGDPVLNPMGWEIEKLDDLTLLVTDGKHGNCNDEKGSGYYFVSAKDIRNDKINYSNSREIPKNEFEEVDKRTNLQPGDLVMINTGATIGRMAIAKNTPKTRKSTFQKSVAVIKVKPELISSLFLKYVFELRLHVFVNKGSGSAIKNLLLSEMRKFKIITPPLNLQNEFAARIKIIETQKQQAQEALEKADNLFNSLLQKAFKGELVK